jgi:hypothetical protein
MLFYSTFIDSGRKFDKNAHQLEILNLKNVNKTDLGNI